MSVCGLRCPYPRPEDGRRARFPRRHRSKRPLPKNPGGRPPPHTIPPLRPVGPLGSLSTATSKPDRSARSSANGNSSHPRKWSGDIRRSPGPPNPWTPTSHTHRLSPVNEPGSTIAPSASKVGSVPRGPAEVAHRLKFQSRGRAPGPSCSTSRPPWSPNQPPTWSLPRQRLAPWADEDRLRSDPAALAAPEAVTHPVTRPGSGVANHIAQGGSPARETRGPLRRPVRPTWRALRSRRNAEPSITRNPTKGPGGKGVESVVTIKATPVKSPQKPTSSSAAVWG
ncbi:MAG: hypothetical protein CM1200mP26_22500 [Acidimicrobiales bacterium]|nr:MAG: hypothetical protein CM1200mP26_22500 [Acidimicrobiales bacterium]